ncbi:uncharacterized protein LOC144354691 [Saccoglossus kowalevskii]
MFLEHEPNCPLNHDGFTKSMEEGDTCVLFERSKEWHNFRLPVHINILFIVVSNCQSGKMLEDVKGLTGRSQLTNSMINAFELFYGAVIRQNKKWVLKEFVTNIRGFSL